MGYVLRHSLGGGLSRSSHSRDRRGGKEHGSSSVKFIVYQDLLDKAARLLPSGVKVVFLADRGFVDHQLLRHIRQHLERALSAPPQVQ